MSQSLPLQPTTTRDGRTTVLLPELALTDDYLDATRTQLTTLADGVLDGELHVDFAQIAGLGSNALGMLVALHRRISDAGGNLVIFGLAPHLRDLFRLTRLELLLHIRAD